MRVDSLLAGRAVSLLSAQVVLLVSFFPFVLLCPTHFNRTLRNHESRYSSRHYNLDILLSYYLISMRIPSLPELQDSHSLPSELALG